MERKYFTILSQNGKHIHKCKHIVIGSHSANDYIRPYWVVDEDDFILGCYKKEEQAIKVIREIYESDGKYEMPTYNEGE